MLIFRLVCFLLLTCLLQAQDELVHSVHSILESGWSHFKCGEWAQARTCFEAAESFDPNSLEAKYGLRCVAEHLLSASQLDHEKTRTEMLESVGEAWSKPHPCTVLATSQCAAPPININCRLQSITIDKVSFNDTPLSRVMDYLGELTATQGLSLTFLALDPQQIWPKVSITLRNLTLDKALDYIARSVGFQVEIQDNAVILRPAEGPGGQPLQTICLSISRGALVRLIGDNACSEKTGRGIPREAGHIVYPSLLDEEAALRAFFARAGVNFEDPSCAFVFDGTQIIATHTPLQLERLQNLLQRYAKTYQVEIEAKFMEVNQGLLEELGFEWHAQNRRDVLQTQSLDGQVTLRSLSNAFAPRASSTGDGLILTPPSAPIPIPNVAPAFPGNINLGLTAPNVANILGVFGNWNINMIVKALEQQADSDLMSAPKLTVVSGKKAEITVAREFRYPECYGKIDAAVGTTATTAITGGSAGVAITAGTPQNFVTRNVGVEMEVTPTVEGEGRWIHLRLEPKVTEFEGFVEYGGSSLAISSGTTVQVPSGFFQPIFSVREIRTEVTIENGATVIMGGLAREEEKRVNDKVPILGDLPIIGQLFCSKGVTNQKRSLLILVTASVIAYDGNIVFQ